MNIDDFQTSQAYLIIQIFHATPSWELFMQKCDDKRRGSGKNDSRWRCHTYWIRHLYKSFAHFWGEEETVVQVVHHVMQLGEEREQKPIFEPRLVSWAAHTSTI